MPHPIRRPALFWRTSLWIALGGALLALAALVDVRVTAPSVTVRWRAEVAPADRAALERRYGLQNGSLIERGGWRYELHDRSRRNLGALVHDPAVDDTGYIDRDAFTARRPDVRVTLRPVTLPFPFSADHRFENPWQLFQWQSMWLLLAGGVLLWSARAASDVVRRNATVAALLLVGLLASALPIPNSLVRMGDSGQVAGSNRFEEYAAVRYVRFEAHLSYTILGRLYRLFGGTEDAARRSQMSLARAATAWFVLSALGIGWLERWSPLIIRYLGLALLAPSALLYFGWHEFGYLSLNVAAFPLIARGLRDGGARLEGGSLLAGLGAALHGWGLVSLGGA